MKQRNNKEMRQMYDQWQTSGISMASFARQQGITRTTLYYWFAKFKKGAEHSESKVKKSFSQIQVNSSSSAVSEPGVTIIFPSGVSIELTGLVEADFIKQLIS